MVRVAMQEMAEAVQKVDASEQDKLFRRAEATKLGGGGRLWFKYAHHATKNPAT